MIKNIISILFLIAGIVLVVLAGKIWFEKNYQESNLFLNDKEIFDLKNFIESGVNLLDDKRINLNEESILVLFLATDDICSPCINEIFLYSELLKNTNFKKHNFQQIIIVIGNDRKNAKKFAFTTEFTIPILYLNSQKLIEKLTEYGKSRSSHQMIFIDVRTEKIFFRAALPKGSFTPDTHKFMVLKEAEKAFKPLL